MNIIESMEWRYACKKFDENKKCSDTQIETIKKAFNLTATSFGLQPVKMLIISNPEIKNNLLEHAYFQQQITTCSHLLVLCIDKNISTDTIDVHFDLVKSVRETSEDIIDKFRKELKGLYDNKTQQEIELSAIHQTYIILGNLMTVCAIEQIDSCPMEGFNSKKFDTELNLNDKNLKSILLLPVGFRAKDDFMHSLKKVRKSIENTVIHID